MPRRVVQREDGSTAPHPAAVCVLLIEDAADTREMFRTYLEHEGYRVEVAADGREGLKKAHVLRPDIIVLDLSLPQIDGWTLCQTLKRAPLTQRIPVIALSGFIDEKSRERAQAAGVDVFLRKPCWPEALVQQIKERMILDTSSATHRQCARCRGAISEQEQVAFGHGDWFHRACILKESRYLIDVSWVVCGESRKDGTDLRRTSDP